MKKLILLGLSLYLVSCATSPESSTNDEGTSPNNNETLAVKSEESVDHQAIELSQKEMEVELLDWLNSSDSNPNYKAIQDKGFDWKVVQLSSPLKRGTRHCCSQEWIPAFAGMTILRQ